MCLFLFGVNSYLMIDTFVPFFTTWWAALPFTERGEGHTHSLTHSHTHTPLAPSSSPHLTTQLSTAGCRYYTTLVMLIVVPYIGFTIYVIAGPLLSFGGMAHFKHVR